MKIETFALERWMTRWETVVRYDLAESGIKPMTVDELLTLAGRDAALERMLDISLGYSEARGTEELRALLAALYRDVTPEEILVTTGAIEANFLLFNVLLNPGDHVIVVDPAYQQLQSVPKAIGCDVSLWKLRPENDFRYDLDELETLVDDHTRLIVINTPHNPTGSVLTPDEQQRVFEIAERVGAQVMGDEAYRWLTLPGREPFAGPVRDLGERGISVGTLSKPFGLPGLRIGWIAATPELVQACWSQRDYVSLSPGKLNDYLATLAIRQRAAIFERTQTIAAENLATLERWLREREDLVSWAPPRGGLLGLLRYDIDVPSMKLADRLAADASVMLAPGSAFGYEHFLRVGIGGDPAVFREGLGRAASVLEAARSEAGPAKN
jgi:aspartate/methionine/tyrosine aminotransferase